MKIKQHCCKLGQNSERGAAMIIAIGAVFILTALGTGIMLLTTNEYTMVVHERGATKAYYMAEAGIEKALVSINSDQYYAGTSVPANLGDGQYEIQVSTYSTTQKVLTATGYYPTKADPVAKRVIRTAIYVDVNATAFSYAMQAGAGGITIGGSSAIQGSLYSNGNIETSGNSCSVSGDAYAHGTINRGPNNPRISGTEVRGAPEVALPEFDMTYWQQKTTAGGTINSYTLGSGSVSLGPKKINGNLTISNGTLTLTGPLWVTGDIRITGGTVRLDPAFGSMGTLLIADDEISLGGNAAYQGTAQGGYLMFVSNKVDHANDGISLSGGSNAFSSVAVYCKEAGISIQGSGDVVGMCAYKLSISGNGDIVYDDGLQSAKFTASPGGGWAVQSGSWRESPD